MTEFFMQHFWLLWLIVAIVCLTLEMTSGDFFLTCFAIGAMVSVLAAAFDAPFWAQVIVFALVSVMSIRLLRPRLLASLHKGKEDRPSNADALMGRIGVVSEIIPADGYGRVKIDGDDWKAESPVNVPLQVGMKVEVSGRDSIIINVKPV